MCHPTDQELVNTIRNHASRSEQVAAWEELERRAGPAIRSLRRRIRVPGQFAARARVGSFEDFAAQVMAKAIRNYDAGMGARFGTWVGRLLENAVSDVFRRREAEEQGTGGGAGDVMDRRPSRERPAPETLVLDEAARLTRECLGALKPASRNSFVWGALLDMTPTELHELDGSVSIDAWKQRKSRAVQDFAAQWRKRGGERLLDSAQAVGEIMAEKAQVSRIPDPEARRAVLLWQQHRDFEPVAKELGVPLEEAKRRLRLGLDLLSRAALRRRGAAAKRDLAACLAISEASGVPGEYALRVERTLALVRAAFGLGPLEAAIDTLGSFIQRRLAGAGDLERARKALGLRPAELRALLADTLPTDPRLLGRLSKWLGVPQARLRALPRRPPESGAAGFRGAGRSSSGTLRDRVFACLGIR